MSTDIDQTIPWRYYEVCEAIRKYYSQKQAIDDATSRSTSVSTAPTVNTATTSAASPSNERVGLSLQRLSAQGVQRDDATRDGTGVDGNASIRMHQTVFSGTSTFGRSRVTFADNMKMSSSRFDLPESYRAMVSRVEERLAEEKILR